MLLSCCRYNEYNSEDVGNVVTLMLYSCNAIVSLFGGEVNGLFGEFGVVAPNLWA